jgi:hypothetical protein
MILSKLTPAETLLVRKGNEATLKDMLKYTLMDLLLKQVLAIEEIQRQPSKHDPVRVYKYIGVGKNFTEYKCLPHELVFLFTYRKNSAIRILFRNCVKIGYENAQTEKAFSKLVMSSGELQKAFTRSFLQKIFNGFSYTNVGNQLKEKVEGEMQHLEKDLPSQINNNKKKALEILKQIGGNIFLLNGIEFSLLKEIDDELLKEFNRPETGGGCGTGCWTTFNTYDHDFDSSCSSDTGGSACSGDGGCSSGCSACGGCGGD